jgi:hypothetical protein
MEYWDYLYSLWLINSSLAIKDCFLIADPADKLLYAAHLFFLLYLYLISLFSGAEKFVIVDCGLRNVLTANQEQSAQGMAHTL